MLRENSSRSVAALAQAKMATGLPRASEVVKHLPNRLTLNVAAAMPAICL